VGLGVTSLVLRSLAILKHLYSSPPEIHLSPCPWITSALSPVFQQVVLYSGMFLKKLSEEMVFEESSIGVREE
jgi:hypothetical protein